MDCYCRALLCHPPPRPGGDRIQCESVRKVCCLPAHVRSAVAEKAFAAGAGSGPPKLTGLTTEQVETEFDRFPRVRAESEEIVRAAQGHRRARGSATEQAQASTRRCQA